MSQTGDKKPRGRPPGAKSKGPKKVRENQIFAELPLQHEISDSESDYESVSGNATSKITRDFTVTLEKIKRNIDRQLSKLEDHFNNAILELRATVTELRDENTALNSKCSQLESRIVTLEKTVESHAHQINVQERFSRRNNVRIVGRQFNSSEDCLAIASEIFKEIEGKDRKIERAHRDGRVTPGKPRHILVKLAFYSDKVDIMKKAREALKDKPYFVVDDLTKIDLNEKRKWAPRVKDLFAAGIRLRFTGGKWRSADGKPFKFE